MEPEWAKKQIRVRHHDRVSCGSRKVEQRSCNLRRCTTPLFIPMHNSVLSVPQLQLNWTVIRGRVIVHVDSESCCIFRFQAPSRQETCRAKLWATKIKLSSCVVLRAALGHGVVCTSLENICSIESSRCNKKFTKNPGRACPCDATFGIYRVDTFARAAIAIERTPSASCATTLPPTHLLPHESVFLLLHHACHFLWATLSSYRGPRSSEHQFPQMSFAACAAVQVWASSVPIQASIYAYSQVFRDRSTVPEAGLLS